MTRFAQRYWPPSFLAWRFALRGALVWLFLRLMTLYAMSTVPDRRTLYDPQLGSAAVIVLVVAITVWIDARRRRELHFLANLGVSSRPVLALAVLPALLLEFLRATAR